MLNKNQSNKRNYWKYVFVLPLLGAFVFFFQVKVIAQEKESEKTGIKLQKTDKSDFLITKNTTDEEIKEFCEQLKKTYDIDLSFYKIKRNSNGEIISIESKFKNKTASGSSTIIQSENIPIKPFKFIYDENKKEIGYFNMDITSQSKDKEIFINGAKVVQNDLDKLDPEEIESMDVIKKSDKATIRIVTKNFSKTLNNNEIYINGEKADKNEVLLLDQNTIDKMDVNSDGKTIRIITKTVNQSSDDVDIPTPPTPPTPPTYKLENPKPPIFPKAPRAPKDDPLHGDKKAWKEYESKMEDFNKKMEAMEPEMKAFEKKMEEFQEKMEPFNDEMEAFDKKKKIYEQQMEEYQSKLNAKKGK